MKPRFSIIIPVRAENDYLKETLSHLQHQTYKYFEVLVITDKISNSPNPAQKRNIGAKMARGRYLAFFDDDSYPSASWLSNAALQFTNSPKLAAVCGPCLTPPGDNFLRQASGMVWGSYLGSGGAGTYRNSIGKPRYVDDYPSVNLIVRKDFFDKINGFDTHHWPGEDTIFCLNLTHKLHQKILYHPSVIVYHHRREILIPHLQQIKRYALHRGNFARIYPKTSFRIGYFIPSFFLIYCTTLIFFHPPYYLLPLILYLLLLLLTWLQFLSNSKNLALSLIAVLTIPITHLYYGFLFIRGFFSKKINFLPHSTDKQGNYLGG